MGWRCEHECTHVRVGRAPEQRQVQPGRDAGARPTVRIGPEPGTTTHARAFPLRVGGIILYTLVDTPGFQRARAALDWMKQHETDAGSRPAVVQQFVREHQHDARFSNECELLRPIVEGAGLIYVVDGATPYGSEYDAEMEILRWTGQPGLAVNKQSFPP